MNQSEFTLQVERLIESLIDMSKKVDYISIEKKINKTRNKRFL